MRNFFISRDPNYRAVTETPDGKLIGFPHADGGKIDGTNPIVLDGWHELSDEAGICERSHLPDKTIERIVTEFTQTLSI